ncbi:DUF2207 domain-containing protein [candidate division KSB1 bacterium]|nr:DUF2207 domain-containing protein [candidate division KSB1 bacterium]
MIANVEGENMQRYSRFSLFMFGLACMLVALQPARAAKSFDLAGAFIEARLNSDGSLEIKESRTYDFDGSFSYAYRTLPLHEDVQYSRLSLREGDVVYQQNDSKQPGTFSLERDSDELTIRWNYKARNEKRTFEFSFLVHGAVKRYRDAAVFYYQFVGPAWEKPHKEVNILLRPPEGLTAQDVRQWLHGPLWAQSSTEPDGTVLAMCEGLPRHTYLELRALYPSHAFPGLPVIDRSVRETVMQEEAAWAEAANQERQRQIEKAERREARFRLGLPIAIILSIIGSIIWIRIYRNHRISRPDLPSVHLNSDIPEEMPPAWVGYVLHGRNISGNDMVATLLDLARRNILSIKEQKVQKKGWFGSTSEKTVYTLILDRQEWHEKSGDLRGFESDLLEFIFDELAKGSDQIDLDQLEKESSKMSKFFTKWHKTVSESAKEQDFYVDKSLKGSTRGILFSFLMMVVCGGLAVLFGFWLLLPAALGFIFLFASLAIPQRSLKGERLWRQWKGLEKYLKKYHFRSQTRQHLLQNMDRYLVYGVVLGLSKKLTEELASFIPQDQVAHIIPWYVVHGSGFSPASFAPAFSSMVSTMSSSSGTGGGASVGGGGGAGGGGGGAG